MEHLFTIGAHGYHSGDFFIALRDAEIDLFLDIRRRRGMRGRVYSYANAARLQEALGANGIAYRHIIGLAPEQVTRELQQREDDAAKVARRKRVKLGIAFITDYEQRTLDTFDWDALIRDLEAVRRPVLFCVEHLPEACHRSLAAARLAERTGVPVTHLVP